MQKKLKRVVFILSPLLICLGFVCFKSPYKPKVFDCFLFFNELDVLEIRLHEMYDAVDKIVLIESTRTFQNIPKPLYFEENKQRYAPYLDKIVHVIIDEYPEFNPVGKEDYWEVETYQRDQLSKALKRCHPHKRDVIINSDLDEIIKKEKIDEIKRLIDEQENDLVFGEFVLYGYFLNRKIPTPWNVCVATSWENFSKYIHSGHAFRTFGFISYDRMFRFFEKIKRRHPEKKWGMARVQDIGWHFTSVGHYSRYLEKLFATAHVSVNTEAVRDIENIRKGINGLECCAIDSSFPEYIQKNEEALRAKGLIDEMETTFH